MTPDVREQILARAARLDREAEVADGLARIADEQAARYRSAAAEARGHATGLRSIVSTAGAVA